VILREIPHNRLEERAADERHCTHRWRRRIEEQVAQARPDLLGQLLITFIKARMSADADSVRRALRNPVRRERMNRRNGYRHRYFDTRTGTLDQGLPKLRTGRYFPE